MSGDVTLRLGRASARSEVNMKPVCKPRFTAVQVHSLIVAIVRNMTAPGRPGRKDQASLTAMDAVGLGWGLARLLR